MLKKFSLVILLFSLVLLSSSLALAVDYHIGPDQDYAHLADINWLTLQAGDNVYIHYRAEPYRELIGLRVQGTAQNPISIIGVPNQDGDLPILSGEDALVDNQFSGIFYTWESNGELYSIADFGVIIVAGDHDTDPYEYKASNIIIKNLKIVGARPPSSYTFHDGSERYFIEGAAGVRVFNGDNITVTGCEITENGNGIFLNGHGTERTITRNTLIEKNHIYANGNIGRDREHNIYSQGINTTIQYNWIEPLQEGALGSSIKDRSAGTIIKYNWVESSARTIDLVEPEDNDVGIDDPIYDLPVEVYGNVIINDASKDPHSTNMIHYGGDTGITEIYRRSPLLFYHNTVFIKSDRSNEWRMRLFDVSTDNQDVYFSNNIVHLESETPEALISNFYLMNEHGQLFLQGTNWIQEGWSVGESGRWFGQSFEEGTIIEGENPGFVNSGTDFNLLESSDAIDQANSQVSQVDKQYQEHQTFTARIIQGLEADLGAYELASTQAICEATQGECYYVSPTGSDSNDGNFENPFQTVQHGINTIEPGDFLYMREGTYVENIELPFYSQGRPDAWFTVKSYPGEWAVLNAQHLRDCPVIFYMDATQNGCGEHSSHTRPYAPEYWNFNHFEVRGGGDAPDSSSGSGMVFNNGYNLNFSYLYVHDNYARGNNNPGGIVVNVPANVSIKYSVFDHNACEENENCGAITFFSDYRENPADVDISRARIKNEIAYNYFLGSAVGVKSKNSQYLTFDHSGENLEYKDYGDKIHHNIFVDQSHSPIISNQDFTQIYNNVIANSMNRNVQISECSNSDREPFHVVMYNNLMIGSKTILCHDNDDTNDHSSYEIGVPYGDYIPTDIHPHFHFYNNIEESASSLSENGNDLNILFAWNWDMFTLDQINFDTIFVENNLFWPRTDDDNIINVGDDENDYSATEYLAQGWTNTIYTSTSSGLHQTGEEYLTNPNYNLGSTTLANAGLGGNHPYLENLQLPEYVGPFNPNDDDWFEGVLSLTNTDFLRDSTGEPSWVEDESYRQTSSSPGGSGGSTETFDTCPNPYPDGMIFCYDFEDWTGDADTTPNYFSSNAYASYWDSHELATEVVASGNPNCGGRNAHSGDYYFHQGFFTGAIDPCLGTQPDSINPHTNIGINGRYPADPKNNLRLLDLDLSNTLTVRTYFRVTDAWPSDVMSVGNKFFRLYSEGTSGTQLISVSDDGTTIDIYDHPRPSDPEHTWDDYHNMFTSPVNWNDGEWHSITAIFHTFEEPRPNGDIMNVSVWIDDWDMLEPPHASAETYTEDWSGIYSNFALMVNWDAQYPDELMGIDFDDIEIWDGVPGELAGSTGAVFPGDLDGNNVVNVFDLHEVETLTDLLLVGRNLFTP